MALLDPQPTSGSWVEIDPYTGPWVEFGSGSWVKIDSYTGWKQGGWHVGKVVW